MVLVTSTTGDGEPPDTALKFVRRINKKTLPDDFLSDLNYTVLGKSQVCEADEQKDRWIYINTVFSPGSVVLCCSG